MFLVKKRRGNLNTNSIAGGILFVFAVIYTTLAFMIPASSFTTAVVGPSVFPIAIGVLLAITSLALLINGIIESRSERVMDTESIGNGVLYEPEENHEQSSINLLVIIGLLFGYILLFFSLGYVLSTILFIFSTTVYLDRQNWIRNLIYSIVFPVVVFFLFNDVLSVYLPTGPFS
jgi:putative tricarboxylic transport membrane protein